MVEDSGVQAEVTNLHAVIMAGGSGTRFWPFSRKVLPKQFLPLSGDASLLRQTFERLRPLVGAQRTWVITNVDHVDRVAQELPELPASQIIGEPVGRNTAPCIGLAAQCIAALDPDARLFVCPADHVIAPEESFRRDVRTALDLLSSLPADGDPLTVTFGIRPRYAATGFGYIERGEAVASERLSSGDAYRVAGFREKPTHEVASQYVDGGQHYWNSGMFLWSVEGISTLIAKYLPELQRGLQEIAVEAQGDAGLVGALSEHFGGLPAESIDYGVLEHTSNVAVVESTFEWDDVGSWAALDRYCERDDVGNRVRGQHVGVDTKNCLIVGQKRLIATVGVEDLVVVETEDAVLVCKRDQTERVKNVVDALREGQLEEFL